MQFVVPLMIGHCCNGLPINIPPAGSDEHGDFGSETRPAWRWTHGRRWHTEAHRSSYHGRGGIRGDTHHPVITLTSLELVIVLRQRPLPADAESQDRHGCVHANGRSKASSPVDDPEVRRLCRLCRIVHPGLRPKPERTNPIYLLNQ